MLAWCLVLALVLLVPLAYKAGYRRALGEAAVPVERRAEQQFVQVA